MPPVDSPIRAGEIDWAAHWRRTVLARMALGEDPGPERSPSHWDSRAERFARMSRALDPNAEPLAVALRAAVRPSDTVLDVGAGAGRYTFAVTPLVRHVTAVEPSPGMRAALQEEAARRGVTNVSVVPASWQEAEVEPHDFAFVANVLYFVADIVPFIEKLDRSARRACYIVHRVEERASIYGELLTDLTPNRPPEAGFLDLYNLLFAMGIRANANLVRAPLTGRCVSLDEAVADARQSLGISPGDHARDERIRAYLTRTLVDGPEGLGFARGPQMAVVWWEKEQQ